jgi:hypothetical protein
MKRFPSGHGARVAFDPVRSATPMPRARPIPRAAAIPRELAPEPRKERAPSFAEIDVVEANLTADPRYDRD